ncbi:DUF5667 domain-containing protein [Nocardioides flavescens]|uniref:DUF5667 domain-containing protein n=1 Tax=Nocardioides flavescens TaxID=2691959 RepID=A0A6L7F0C0_9ACTN|nr:DUF5667 domain-containing protein [Nocardioides flavescens]MXG89831.1 hypothetical protein [Nocardioides flavescens]
MTALHPARRRAERFDALLDDRAAGDAPVDARTAELLELVGALRSVPRPEPRPEFVADLRAQLMEAARTELVAEPGLEHGADRRTPDALAARLTVPARTRRDRRVGIALGAVAIVGATSSMAVASQGALPGDALYPVKRVIERTEAGLSTSDAAKGRTLLDDATDRLGEVGEMTRDGDADAALVSSTLATFTEQARQGSDLLMSDYAERGSEASVERIRSFAAVSMGTLGRLDADVPEASQPALLDAAQALFEIDAAAELACPGCAGDGITEIPGQLLASAETGTDEELPEASGPVATPTPSDTPSPDALSGQDVPQSPVQVPTLVVTTPTTPTQTPTQAPTQGQTQGQQGQPQTALPSVKPPKPPTAVPTVDVGQLTQQLNDTLNDTVTGTVDGAGEVVDGVVQGVTGLLGGLTGQTPTPRP